jgi:hypothetical protein
MLQQQPTHSDDDVSRMLEDFEQYFAMDKQARQQKLQQLESRQRKIDESLASIERKNELARIQQQVAQEQEAQQEIHRRQQEKEQESAFLHQKVVHLAKALAKMTRDRDRLDLELAKAKIEVLEKDKQISSVKKQQQRSQQQQQQQLISPSIPRTRQQIQDEHSAFEEEKEIWKREIVSLRNALENHVISDRKDRHAAQQDKEIVLNEVAEELGQVMAQRDLAFVELEKLKRLHDYKKKDLLLLTSSTSASSLTENLNKLLPPELETAEKQIGALQLQLAHARRDVTVQSVNLHVANEKYSSLKEDVEKACGAFQTTSDQCNHALTILTQSQQQQAGSNFIRLSSSQVSELILFVSRVRSDFSNISSLLSELRSGSGDDDGQPKRLM